MTTERQPSRKIPTVESLRSISVEERFRRIESLILDTKSNAAEVSAILLSLEADGVDTSCIKRRTIVKHMLQVHSGILINDAFDEFLGTEYMLKAFASLPADEQRKLMEKGEVEMCDVVNGQATQRLVKLANMTAAEAKLFFDIPNHKTRSLSEQAHELYADRVKEKMRKRQISHEDDGRISCDGFTFKEIAAYAKKHGI